jgi:hypothetical protein
MNCRTVASEKPVALAASLISASVRVPFSALKAAA